MSEHGSALAASGGIAIAVPREVRGLQAADLAGFGRHLQRLESDCRRSRFGLAVSDAFLRDYADRVDLANTSVLGCFADGELRGVCELRSLRSQWCAEAELAFTVEKAWRGRGIGTALMAQAIRAARPLGIEHLYLTCHRGNRGMQCIAAKFAASMSYDDGECFADISMHCQPMSALLGPRDGGAPAHRMVVLDL
jgi:GNAT superfamily N-acetyltransferase